MTNNFEAKVNSIISNLNSKISQLAAKGENKNKQIETRGEKNQLSELLAGAEDTHGGFRENRKAVSEPF